MKKNFILLSILCGLLAFTYWFEELGREKKLSREKQAKALFQDQNLGKLKGITFPKFQLLLKNEKYFTQPQNYPADKRKVDKITEIFSALEVVAIIARPKIPRKYFFPQENLTFSFNFEQGDLTYRLGAKLEFSQDFYMEVIFRDQRNLVVVRDASPQMGLYSEKSLERSSQKYDRLVYILGLREKDLFDTYPFKNISLNLDKVYIDNIRNKKFLVDFKNKTTDPVIFKHLNYNQDFFGKLEQKLKGFYAINIHFSAKEYKDLQSTIYLPQQAQLYKRFKGREGYFLKVAQDPDLYEIAKDDAEIFFYNYQDFWKKELIKDQHLPATFIFQNKPQVTVKIRESQPFEVQSFNASFNAKRDSFRKIYSLLLNAADRVSQWEPLKGKSIFEIQINDLKYKILKVKDDLLFVNEKANLMYIYEVGMENPINEKFEDYFYPIK